MWAQFDDSVISNRKIVKEKKRKKGFVASSHYGYTGVGCERQALMWVSQTQSEVVLDLLRPKLHGQLGGGRSVNRRGVTLSRRSVRDRALGGLRNIGLVAVSTG